MEVGDKVLVTKEFGSGGWKGMEGIVVASKKAGSVPLSYWSEIDFGVKFGTQGEEGRGHFLGGILDQPHGWWFPKENLEKVEEVEWE